MRRGDFDAAFAMFAPDIVFTISGRSRFAGERRGRESAMAYIETVKALSHAAGIEVEVLDALTSDERLR